MSYTNTGKNGKFRSRFPESFQKPTRDTLAAVESLSPWNKTQADTKVSHALVTAILNTQALVPSCHTPQMWSVQQVCTQLLLKQTHAPQAQYQATHEPLVTPTWKLLTKLVPPQISIYYPWASPGEILKWKRRGNKVFTQPAPGQDTTDVGDMVGALFACQSGNCDGPNLERVRPRGRT